MSPEVREYEPLARYVGWRIGGPARYFATATQATEMAELVQWARLRDLPIFVLGGGTNILIADAGYPGLVIRNRAMTTRIEAAGEEATLIAEAGAPMAGTTRRYAARGFGGLTWAEGLPGTVGGAIYGNAGCYGGDIAANLVSARVLLPTGEVEEWPQERFQFGYRTSVLKHIAGTPSDGNGSGLQSVVVLEGRLRLQPDDPEKLAQEMAAIAAERRSKTPSGSSCGSSFKNPQGTSAGRLLDQAGLKGTRVGGAVVAERHANYIVNDGGATAADVLRLTAIMRERVLHELGIKLELEVQLVGDFGPTEQQ